LGNYNPHAKKLEAKIERILYWVSKGAQVSPTVNNLLVNYKYWDKPKVQSWRPKVKPTDNPQPTTNNEKKLEVEAKAEPAQAEATSAT